MCKVQASKGGLPFRSGACRSLEGMASSWLPYSMQILRSFRWSHLSVGRAERLLSATLKSSKACMGLTRHISTSTSRLLISPLLAEMAQG